MLVSMDTLLVVNLGDDYIFSDASLSSSASLGGGSGGAIEVIIGPDGGHGGDAVQELGGHFVMLQPHLHRQRVMTLQLQMIFVQLVSL